MAPIVTGDPISTWLELLCVCALCVEVCIVRCMCVCVCVVYMVLCMCYEGVGGLPGWPVRWRQLSEGAGQSALRKLAYQRTGN